jgi:8-oxo-dGTP pyrophosphatase MutT (NUDIX family)
MNVVSLASTGFSARFTLNAALDTLRRVLPDLPGYVPGGHLLIAQAVVLRGQGDTAEVLLVKRTSPCAWELPGGNLDPGEPPEQAAVREVREETGLSVRIDRLLGWYERTGFRPHRSPVYVCSVLSGTPRPNQESYEARFFPAQHLPLGLFPWYRPLIRDAVTGRIHLVPVHQHLGVKATTTAGLIHLGEIVGLLR